MTDYEEMEIGAHDRHAFEWGLASLLTGSVLALGALLVLIFNVLIWVNYPRAIPMQFVQLLFYIGIVAMVVVVLTCLISLGFAFKALRSASASGQPAGLAVAGILVNLLALGAWIFVGIDLIMILGTYANVRL